MGLREQVVVALALGQFEQLTRIAGEMDRPDRPLGAVDAEFVAAIRIIAELESAPLPAVAALGSVGELLLEGNDPPDGARLLLIGASLALVAGDIAAARATLKRSSAACAQLGHVPDALDVLGGLAVDSGNAAEGTRLLAAAVALSGRMGRKSLFAGDIDRDHALAATTLGDDTGRT